MKVLQRIVAKAEAMKNMPLALQVLEQAAKECGDMYVNRRIEPVDPGAGGAQSQPAPEYVLRPDEPIPENPIL
ncbi:hypothetical protein D3C79_1003070 [compost metagenome]